MGQDCSYVEEGEWSDAEAQEGEKSIQVRLLQKEVGGVCGIGDDNHGKGEDEGSQKVRCQTVVLSGKNKNYGY